MGVPGRDALLDAARSAYAENDWTGAPSSLLDADATQPLDADDLERLAWSVWCIRVRPGHRKQGLSHHLLQGAVEFARQAGAPAIEGYPVDNHGQTVDLTMAYVGTRALFEQAGFTKAADITSTLDGFPRVLMRLALS
jgi:GNAT superfamily N-acetyltransferase